MSAYVRIDREEPEPQPTPPITAVRLGYYPPDNHGVGTYLTITRRGPHFNVLLDGRRNPLGYGYGRADLREFLEAALELVNA